MKAPVQVYTPSPRAYTGLPEIEYPLHDRDVQVTALRPHICMHRRKINITTVMRVRGSD